MLKITCLKYLPKTWSSLVFFMLLIIVFILFQGRKYDAFRFSFLIEAFPGYQHHISNFSITYLLCGGIGYMWLFLGVRFIHILAFGIVLIASNLIYELWIPLLNTKDPLDAYFGIAGAVLGILFLAMVKKYGLIINTQ